MMKQFLKVTFVFGLCLRLVLLTSLASAGGSMHDLQKAAVDAILEVQEEMEKLIDELESMDPDDKTTDRIWSVGKSRSAYAELPDDANFEFTSVFPEKNKNPLAKINDAKLKRIDTTEECCEALEDYNNLVASCSRSGNGLVRTNFCNIIFNRQTVLDRASGDVKEKCDASPESDYEELVDACSLDDV